MPPFTPNISQNPATGTIRVKPVTAPTSYFGQIEAKFRQLVADYGVAEMKKNAQSGIFKHPTGALANSFQGRVEGKTVVWWSDHPGAAAQEHGVKPHAMWYLLNKVIPIRMYGSGGETTTFRRATLKSFMRGGWFHKGYPGKGFMKKAVDATVSKIPELLRQAQEAVMRGLPR